MDNTSSLAGILDPDGSVDNPASIKRLAEVSVAYARAGKEVTSNRVMCGKVVLISFHNQTVKLFRKWFTY